MTEINNWLNNKYPNNDRHLITDLILEAEDLEGELDLTEGFPNLERVWYHHQLRIISNYDLTIAKILKEKKPEGIFLKVLRNVQVEKFAPAQELMNHFYPKNSRSGITELDLTQQGLKSSLNLSDFTNLEKLTLNLDQPSGRKYVKSNFIEKINLSQNTKLTELTLTNNQFEARELGDLKHLTKLTKLVLKGDSSDCPAQWTGSLEDLKKLPLITLDVSNNPKITGWKYLPLTIANLDCQGTIFAKMIKPFGFDLKAWKLINFSDLVEADKDKLVKELNNKLVDSHLTIKSLNKIGLTDDDLLNQIELLETKNRELLK